MPLNPTVPSPRRCARLVSTLTLVLCGLTQWAPSIHANQSYADAIAGVPPMSPFGLDGSLARVLRMYYENIYSDFRYWEQLESLRFNGTIQVGDRQFGFKGFKRKPDFYKIILSRPDGSRLTNSFDGRDAWQWDTQDLDAQPVTMPQAEALNFIRDAPIGGHLLYPTQEGKTITLLGTTEVQGREAYHLRIDLPDGQVIQSFLDTKTFAEVRQILVNSVTGKEEITDFSDFREVDGLRVAFKNQLSVDGEIVHQVKMHEMQTDAGVMTWMFERPEHKEASAQAAEELPAPLAPMANQDGPEPFGRALNETIAESSSFSVDRPNNDPWAPSAFGATANPKNAETSFFTEPTPPAFFK